MRVSSAANMNLEVAAPECSINFSYTEKWFIIQSLPFVFLFIFIMMYIGLIIKSKYDTCREISKNSEEVYTFFFSFLFFFLLPFKHLSMK